MEAVCENLPTSGLYAFEAQGSSTVSFQPTDGAKFVCYISPAGKLITLPIEAKPKFGTSTNLSIPKGCLVGFKLNEVFYAGNYKKEDERWVFKGYFSITDGKIYKDLETYKIVHILQEKKKEDEITKGQVEVAGVNYIIPVALGLSVVGEAVENIIAIGTIAEQAKNLALKSIRVTGLAIVGYLIMDLFMSPPLPYNYGEGDTVGTLPKIGYPPQGIPIDIPTDLVIPKDTLIPKEGEYRIALGIETFLMEFSLKMGAIPYFTSSGNWIGWGDELTGDWEPIKAKLLMLGALPNTVFYFNLATDNEGGRVDQTYKFKKDKTTSKEYHLIYTTPMLFNKTTFYKRSEIGNYSIFDKTKLIPPQ